MWKTSSRPPPERSVPLEIVAPVPAALVTSTPPVATVLAPVRLSVLLPLKRSVLTVKAEGASASVTSMLLAAV